MRDSIQCVRVYIFWHLSFVLVRYERGERILIHYTVYIVSKNCFPNPANTWHFLLNLRV